MERQYNVPLVKGGYPLTTTTNKDPLCGHCYEQIESLQMQAYVTCCKSKCNTRYHWTCIRRAERKAMINGTLDINKWCCLNLRCLIQISKEAISDDTYSVTNFTGKFLVNYFDKENK